MNKMFVALILAILVFITVPVKADTVITEVAPCVNGFHLEDAKGIGVARKLNGDLIVYGIAWQCIHCGECLVTENNPTFFYKPRVGVYATKGWADSVVGGVMSLWTNAYGYEATNRLPGYRFR